MSRLTVCWLLLLILVIVTGCRTKLAPETRYTFHIIDQNGQPIPAAYVRVTWVGQQSHLASTSRTDQQGNVTAVIMMAPSMIVGRSKDLIVYVDAPDFDYDTQNLIHNTQILTLTLHEHTHLQHTIQITRQNL